ncbi:MAG: hypothetical protein BIP78_1660 [Candidatus Bipolaricaulis sibiricus]|uniref:Uncharacterized protein n=1 Tax=Bipolaricaulis sibiricus TaxID=2501609 RepID=A0A410FWN2_BIPS1|nr:MAG: hypothetical protein BIP78_1660 [Candidatus Bipolaricaulis sibiricus]
MNSLAKNPDFLLSLPIPPLLGMREAPSDSGLLCATRRGIDLGRVRGYHQVGQYDFPTQRGGAGCRWCG